MATIIVLERLSTEPPFDLAGTIPCVRCRFVCMLTEKTFAPVAARTYDPLCYECAIELKDELEPPP